jgi:hypothetical protein
MPVANVLVRWQKRFAMRQKNPVMFEKLSTSKVARPCTFLLTKNRYFHELTPSSSHIWPQLRDSQNCWQAGKILCSVSQNLPVIDIKQETTPD